MTGEIAVIVVVIALIGVIVYQGIFIKKLADHFADERKDLLNRVMSRNYETFVQGDVVRAEVKKSLTAEEIMELQQERGIPV
jgi:hypothetical protein